MPLLYNLQGYEYREFITSILKLLLVNTCIFEMHALWRMNMSSSDEVWVTINLSELQTSLNYKHLLITNNISELQTTSLNYKQHLWITNISELQTISRNYKQHLCITNNIHLGLTNNISELLTTFCITNSISELHTTIKWVYEWLFTFIYVNNISKLKLTKKYDK